MSLSRLIGQFRAAFRCSGKSASVGKERVGKSGISNFETVINLKLRKIRKNVLRLFCSTTSCRCTCKTAISFSYSEMQFSCEDNKIQVFTDMEQEMWLLHLTEDRCWATSEIPFILRTSISSFDIPFPGCYNIFAGGSTSAVQLGAQGTVLQSIPPCDTSIMKFLSRLFDVPEPDE